VVFFRPRDRQAFLSLELPSRTSAHALSATRDGRTLAVAWEDGTLSTINLWLPYLKQ
jgi:hypothetical protein